MTPRLLVPAALAALLAGCSLGTSDYTPCETHAECRDAFGFGWTCGDEGLCAEVEVEPRCETTWPEDLFSRPENYRDAVVLGSLFDHGSDTPETQAARLAFMQVDDVSGLDGRPYVLVECDYAVDYAYDDLSLEDAAARGASFLADTLGVPAIIGPATSGTAEAAYYAASPAGTVVLSPSATSPALSSIDGLTKTDESPGLFWRTAPPDSLQGEVVAGDILDREVYDVSVIYRTGSYGGGLASVFDTAYRTGGGQITLLPFSDDTERDLAVAAVRETPPTEILFISSEPADIVAFLNTAHEYAELADVGIFLTDTARDQEVLDAAASAADLFDQVRGTAPSVRTDQPVYGFFAGAYAAEYAPAGASDSVYTAHTWDAAWLAIYGVAWSVANEGAISGLGVARGLRRVSDGDAIDINPINWTQVRATFDEGRGIDVTGASGRLDYDPDTEETTAPIEVWHVADGTFVTDYTIDP